MIAWIIAHWHIGAAVILGIYEVLVRLLPTVSNWSLLALIIKILKAISDAANNKKIAK
jgi:hypothetical protein